MKQSVALLLFALTLFLPGVTSNELDPRLQNTNATTYHGIIGVILPQSDKR